MPETWRLIVDPPLRGSFNMAADFAVLASISAGACPPTLRLYRWERPAVTVGYFQVINEELDAAACGRDGVAVIRRITGGGAVLHEHEITYSVCLPAGHPAAAGTILDSYGRLCAPLVSALRSLGSAAAFSPVNDVLLEGRKVSGSAQTRRWGALLQHGTVLLDVDAGRMFRYLKVADEKLADKGIGDASSRVTSLREWFGERALSDGFVRDFTETLAAAFGERFGAVFERGGLTDEERETAAAVERALFANPAWNEERVMKLPPGLFGRQRGVPLQPQ